ncbi:MAG: DUF4249 domain-containing protein [Bacteroidota bacterium]
MRRLKTICIILLLSSCLDEIILNPEMGETILVVDGYIDTQSSIHEVRLSSTSTLRGVEDKLLIQDAQVTVESESGEIFTLTESLQGVFKSDTNEIVAKTGESYKLNILLSNGERYESSFESIPEPITITSGYAELVERTLIDENLIETKKMFHDVFVELENSNESHFFIVESIGWVEVKIRYESPGLVPPPPPGPTTCWQLRNPINDQVLPIGSNEKVSSDTYSLNAISVPVDVRGQYVAILNVQSMSQSSFLFWQKVEDQLKRSGSIFDRELAPVIGNIRGVNNENRVLGYFHTYASSSIEVCFDRSDVLIINNTPIVNFPPLSDNQPVFCTEVWAPATFDDQSEIFCK